jgi:uncharacterized membrane protein (DUF4010 family)
MLPDMQPGGLPDLYAVATALALGLLIGLQRGWVLRNAPDGSRFAGIRTYGLLGLAGGIAGALQERAAPLALVLLIATAMLVVLGYWRATQTRANISGTASLAGLITLACGFLAGSGEAALASAATGVTVLVLALRSRLHHLISHIDEEEMFAVARFALIALVILPLLPDTAFGPYQAWHPRQLWLVVVLVSGFSFAGYAGVKLLGPRRGILATAAAGAMVSSTAVTASFAGKLRDSSGDGAMLHAGIALASAVMFGRVMALTGVLAGFALPTLASLAVPGMLVSLIGAIILLRRGRAPAGPAQDGIKLRNPFELKTALALAALTMALIVAARWVLARYGDAGLATMLAISGSVDVDSAIITMGNLPPGTLDPRTAGMILLAPITLNSLFKSATLLSIAGWRRGWPGAAIMTGSAATSCAVLAFMI